MIWTDCLQSFVMLFSQSFLAFKLWALLGVDKVWEVSGKISDLYFMSIIFLINGLAYSNGDSWKDIKHFSLWKRTSSWGIIASEFLTLITFVAFGQYFTQVRFSSSIPPIG